MSQVLLAVVRNPRQFGVAEFDHSGQVIGLQEAGTAEERPGTRRRLLIHTCDTPVGRARSAVAASGTRDHRGQS
jgi:hypothetical protein